jgi:hypothetical protein
MAFKAAICPSCGGQLQVPEDRDAVKCMYCGTDIIVRQAIQAGSGINIKNYLELAVTATNVGNFKEAYDYYSKVLEIDIKNPEAWFGKGRSAGWLSTLYNFRFADMKSGFQNALANIPENDKNDLQIQCASVINQVANACYNLSRNHVLEHPSEEGWKEYLSQSSDVIEILEFGNTLNPNNKDILFCLMRICKENIEGVNYKYYVGDTQLTGVRKLAPEYEKTLNGKYVHYANLMKQLDSNFTAAKIQKKSSCCFVITATMGNRYHPYVITLQDFRESWLKKRGYGRFFTRHYERYGPYFADLIRDRSTLRRLSLHLIVIPSVKIATKLLHKKSP